MQCILHVNISKFITMYSNIFDLLVNVWQIEQVSINIMHKHALMIYNKYNLAAIHGKKNKLKKK